MIVKLIKEKTICVFFFKMLHCLGGVLLNILHISRSMGQGGAQKIVLQLCNDDSSKNKHFVASSGGVLVSKLNILKVPHFEIYDMENKDPISIIRNIKKLYSVIHEYKIDIIHAHHRMAAFYSRLLATLSPNLKCIYTAHNIFENKKLFTRFSLKRSTIVAVGQGVANNLENYFEIDIDRINVIYNSVKKAQLNFELLDSDIKRLKEQGRIVVAFIGRLTKQKGVDIFLKAMSIVLKDIENVFGVVIGNGEEISEMKRMCRELGIENRILFLGYKNNVNEIITQVDFVVLPSRWEGFPLTPIEVFSNGKTIVASNISGNNEIVIDKQNGLLFESENYSVLGDRIIRLVKDKKLLKELESGALDSFTKKYEYNVFKKKYLDLYENISL